MRDGSSVRCSDLQNQHSQKRAWRFDTQFKLVLQAQVPHTIQPDVHNRRSLINLYPTSSSSQLLYTAQSNISCAGPCYSYLPKELHISSILLVQHSRRCVRCLRVSIAHAPTLFNTVLKLARPSHRSEPLQS